VNVVVVGVGDIHDPDTIPFVLISGRMLDKDGAEFPTKDGFKAIIHKKQVTLFLETKRTRSYIAEVNTIVKYWGEWEAEGDPSQTNGGQSLSIMGGTSCSICGSKGMPCFYGRGHSGNHCIFCMLEGIAEWSANPGNYKNNR
jgi:hypothetical protein